MYEVTVLTQMYSTCDVEIDGSAAPQIRPRSQKHGGLAVESWRADSGYIRYVSEGGSMTDSSQTSASGGFSRPADSVERRAVAAGIATDSQILLGPADGMPEFLASQIHHGLRRRNATAHERR